jgi:hypothetical protein
MIPLDHADEWLALGARVVPLLGKNPGALLGRDWPQKATADPDVLAEWRQRWPRANLGVLPGHAFLALDVDDPQALRERESELGPLPPTPGYITGGAPDRRRLLFTHPQVPVRTRPVPGIELRDRGLQIMVPPSVHPVTGVVLEWRTALDELPLAPLPARWLNWARGPTTNNGPRPAGEYAALGRGVHEGQRNASCARLAGYLLRRHVDPAVVYELLLGWGARCRPPCDSDEIQAVVLSVARAEARRRGGLTSNGGGG